MATSRIQKHLYLLEVISIYPVELRSPLQKVLACAPRWLVTEAVQAPKRCVENVECGLSNNVHAPRIASPLNVSTLGVQKAAV